MKRADMKKESVLLITCAMSLALTGCESADGPNLSRMQNAALVKHCIPSTQAVFFNGKSVDFNSPSITGTVPNAGEVDAYTTSFLYTYSNKEKELEGMKEYINSNPLIFQSVVSIKNGSDTYSCKYLYSTDGDGNLKKLPYLYAHQKNNEKLIPYRTGTYVRPYHAFEYIKEYPLPTNGIKLYQLNTASSLSPSSPQANILSVISNKLTAAMVTQNHFTLLDEVVQPTNAAELANYAVANLYIPEYIPENPMYLVPVVVSKRIQRIGEFHADDNAVKKMEDFNKKRYVDSETGISNHLDVLKQMEREFGLNQDNVVIEHVDRVGKLIDQSNVPNTLEIKTQNYTDKELERSQRYE